jgi:hypothetical protein
MKFTYRIVLAALCAALVFTSCGNDYDNEDIENAAETEIAEAADAYDADDVSETSEAADISETEAIEEFEEDVDEDEAVETAYDFEVQAPDEFDVTLLDHDGAFDMQVLDTPHVLVSDEDNGIWIYGYYEGVIENIIIEHNGIADRFYGQNWLTPRAIMPTLNVYDYDGDGADELAVSYYTLSGTGISYEELVIYKLNADGRYEGYKFNDEYLYSQIEIEKDFDNYTLTFTDKNTGNGVTSQIRSENQSMADAEMSSNDYFGYETEYELRDGSITVSFSPGNSLAYESQPVIQAEITFDGSDFSVGGITFTDYWSMMKETDEE